MSDVVLRGRAEPMNAALAALRGVRSRRHGGVILVEGEPGIGKTALFSEIVAQAGRMGFRCGVSKADQIGRMSPAAPLLVAVRSGPQPLVSMAELQALAGQVGNPLLLLEELTNLLEEQSRDTPLLIGLDDAHWADPVTRFALRALPGRLSDSPILWLMAGQIADDSLMDEFRRAAIRSAPVESIVLGPLAADDIEAMAADRLGTPPSPAVRRFLGGVAGNPFFATQILSGVLRANAADAEQLDIPAEFRLGVQRRIGELGPPATALMAAAAVFGQPITVDDVAALLGHPDGQVDAAVDAAVRAHLLDREQDGLLVFRHDLIRQAVYLDLTVRARRDLHQRCARHLTQIDGDPLLIATHARTGLSLGDENAATMLAEAASRCAGSMPEIASELITTAFRAVRPNQTSWARLGEQAVELLSLVQRCTEALEIADLLLAHLDDDEAAGRIEIAVTRALWLTGRWHASLERSSRALTRPHLSSVLRSRLTALHALAVARVEPAAQAIGIARSALDQAERVDDDDARVLARNAMAEVSRNRGDHAESLQHHRALRAAVGGVFAAQEILGLQHLDRFDDADVMMAQARHDLAGDRGIPFMSLIFAQIWRDYCAANFDDAEAGAHTLLNLALERGSHSTGVDAASVLAMVALQRGEVTEARQCLGIGSGPAGADDEMRKPSLLLVRGWVTAAEGDLDRAMDLLAPVVFAGREERDPWPFKPGWLPLLGHLGLRAGDEKFLDEVLALADLGADRNPHVPSLVGSALQLHGLVDQDLHLLERAVDVLARSPRPMLVARAYADLGVELVRRERRQDGAAALDQAWEIYHQVGAAGPLNALQTTMRQAGLRRSKWTAITTRPSAGWQALTPSELKVARLIGAGYTNKAASKQLGVSANTVGTHLRAVFAKLGVQSRVQLTNLIHDWELRDQL